MSGQERDRKGRRRSKQQAERNNLETEKIWQSTRVGRDELLFSCCAFGKKTVQYFI
jgi:hypothetical protein